jgi:hypothetical protein
MATPPNSLDHLTDAELLKRLRDIVQDTHRLTAELLSHLAEVERRELHLKAACSSMFAYCTQILGFDEAAAYNRICAARLARRFPLIVEMVADGRLHLTGVKLLGPHLTQHNHLQLLEQAAGKSKRQIQELLAERTPKPDVPAKIRKLPRRPAGPEASSAQPDLLQVTPPGPEPAKPPGVAPAGRPSPPTTTDPAPASRRSAAPPEPLGRRRYKVEFTASAELVGKLEEVQALLSHREPGCDVARVVERAVDLLRAELLKERFGVGAKPAGRGANKKGRKATTSRHVPRAVRREVVARDGLRCAYVDPQTKRRCTETNRLELQHHEPFGQGGEHSADNVSLFCRSHNAYAARRDFGWGHMAAAIGPRARQRRQQPLFG